MQIRSNLRSAKLLSHGHHQRLRQAHGCDQHAERHRSLLFDLEADLRGARERRGAGAGNQCAEVGGVAGDEVAEGDADDSLNGASLADALDGIIARETKTAGRYGQILDTTVDRYVEGLLVGGIALIGIAIALAMALSRSIALPITRLTDAMASLAAGKNDVDVNIDRADELGDMARAVTVFRDAAVAAVNLPEMKQQFLQQGAAAVTSTPAEYQSIIRAESDKWRGIISKAKISLE